MMKPKIYSLIPMFLLSISLLSVSQVYAIDNNVTENIISDQNPNRKSNVSQALHDLENAVKSFNKDIREVVKENKNPDKVNSKNILEKLDKLEKQLALPFENSQTSQIVNEANSIISEFDKITKPLESGLTRDGVIQVQKNLNFFKRRNIDEKFYGTFGKTTQEEIELFTNKKIKELDKQIISLEFLIGQKEIKSISAVSSQINNSNNKNYEIELNTIKTSLTKITITVIILGFVLAGLIIFCIYRIITLIEQQRQIANSLKNNHTQKFIDIDKFQIELNEIYKRVNNFDARLKQIERSIQNQTQSNYSSVSHNPTNVQSHIEEVSQPQPIVNQSYQSANISNTNIGLVSIYNRNPRSLLEQATSVSETEFTSEQRRLGKNIQPSLESDNRGNYWIVTENNNDYLVPKANIRINEHNYLTISTFFHCLGYNSNSLNNFTLLKPAKVHPRGEKWELIEVGELQF